MKALAPVVKAALLVGLFEGGLIAGHLFLAGEGPPRGPLDILVDAGRVVALHLTVWLALGALLLTLTRDRFALFRGVVTIWVIAAFVARQLVQGQAGPGAHPLLLVVLLGLWLTPRAWWPRLRPFYRTALACAAVLVVSVYSLWGRAPDFRFELEALGWLYLGSATVAIGLVFALFRWPRATAAALAVLVSGTVLWTHLERSFPADRPSVLFVLVDTARRDHVSPFQDLVQTPAIDHLASRGVVFSDAVTVIPKTAQSVASIFTGRYPVHHGLRALYDHLSPAQPNLARAFQSAGYPTTALVNNPWVSPGHGFGHGFDRYYGTDEIREDFGGSPRFVTWDVLYDQAIRRRVEWRPPQPGGFFKARAGDLTDATLRVLSRQREPFFLYVHYFQPHWPYQPPPRLQRRYDAPAPATSVVNNIEESAYSRGQMIFDNPLPEGENEGARRLYRGEMDDTMAEVGRLLEVLDRSTFGDDTIVVLTADHGHALGEHDYSFHHGAFLYDASIRIPLILSWPGHLPEGLVVEHQVRSIDLAPTLFDLAGVTVDTSLDGRSLTGYWRDGEDRPRGALLESDVRMMKANRRREVGGVLGKLRAWRSGRHKLILTPAIEGPRWELFDLAEDPEETRDLSGEESHQATLQALRDRLSDALPEEERDALSPIEPEAESPSGDPESGVSDTDLELLRQLGYVE